MALTVEMVTQEALGLPVSGRALVVESLLADVDRKRFKQDLQDEQDGKPLKERSPNSEASWLLPTCFFILQILFILSNSSF